jgi:hypothetical protein
MSHALFFWVVYVVAFIFFGIGFSQDAASRWPYIGGLAVCAGRHNWVHDYYRGENRRSTFCARCGKREENAPQSSRFPTRGETNHDRTV